MRETEDVAQEVVNVDEKSRIDPKDEIVISRVFEAPKDLVWRTWTEPERLKLWWGPEGFTAPIAEMDLRVGGCYFSCMRSPEGQDYCSTGTFREIIPEERLVLSDSFADEHGNVVSAEYYDMGADLPLESLVTVTFKDEGDRTRMTLHYAGIPEGEQRMQAEVGWNQMFDKLARSLM